MSIKQDTRKKKRKRKVSKQKYLKRVLAKVTTTSKRNNNKKCRVNKNKKKLRSVWKMKLLGANDDMNGGRGPSSHRSQDDAAVGYVFQRHPHETVDFPHFSHKQAPQPPRWASGDETIIDVSNHLLSIFTSFFLFLGLFR